jgi:hypothetical protein
MPRDRPPSGWRAISLAVALFAITLNFLQPLAHAAAMRDAGPDTAARMWGAFCQAPASPDDSQAPAPAVGKAHECCLGLAHAPGLAELSTTFVLIELVTSAIHFVAVVDGRSPFGIRDGPSQPRAPPFPV